LSIITKPGLLSIEEQKRTWEPASATRLHADYRFIWGLNLPSRAQGGRQARGFNPGPLEWLLPRGSTRPQRPRNLK